MCNPGHHEHHSLVFTCSRLLTISKQLIEWVDTHTVCPHGIDRAAFLQHGIDRSKRCCTCSEGIHSCAILNGSACYPIGATGTGGCAQRTAVTESFPALVKHPIMLSSANYTGCTLGEPSTTIWAAAAGWESRPSVQRCKPGIQIGANPFEY